MGAARARALTCVAGDDHPGVSELVFWAPSTTRVSVSAARATTPRLRCSDASLQCGARRGRCVRVTASTRRARAAATTRMFPQRHVPTANSRRIGAALGDAGCSQRCVHRDKTLSLRDPPRNCAAMRPEMLPMCSSASSNASSNFFAPTCYGVSARQQLVSTTASKPLVPCVQRCCAGTLLEEMPLLSH